MTTQPDNLEPWQRVARELGTWDSFDGPGSSGKCYDDEEGKWTKTEPACREIARLRQEVERLRNAETAGND